MVHYIAAVQDLDRGAVCKCLLAATEVGGSILSDAAQLAKVVKNSIQVHAFGKR